MATLAIGGPRADRVPGPGARIDWTHPLANGLILCCPTPWYDIARGNPITPNADIGYGSHALGMGAALTSTQQFDVADEASLHNLTEFSVAGWGLMTGSIVLMLTRDEVAANWGIALWITTSGGMGWQVKCTGGIQSNGGGTSVAGQTQMAAGTFKEGLSYAYLNGTRVGTNALANGPYSDNASIPFTLGRSPLFAGGSSGVLGPVMMWNRVLTHGEIQQLHATPFAMVAST